MSASFRKVTQLPVDPKSKRLQSLEAVSAASRNVQALAADALRMMSPQGGTMSHSSSVMPRAISPFAAHSTLFGQPTVIRVMSAIRDAATRVSDSSMYLSSARKG